MTPKRQSPRSLSGKPVSPTVQRSPLASKGGQQTPYKRVKVSNTTNTENHAVVAADEVSNGKNPGENAFVQHHEDGFDELANDDSTQDHESLTPSRKQAYAFNGGYNALKSFNGQVYSGMAVGGSHVWNYDPGVWKETKEEPDLWKIDYQTTKRRAKNAPAGSGAPVGTEYHWLIVAHQYVKKVDANTYETHLAGSKYKLAHKNSSSNSWSIPTVKVQRDREIELLDDAKRRVQGLPPVLSTEKVRVEKTEKGQQKLESLFSRVAASKDDNKENLSNKRKRSVSLG